LFIYEQEKASRLNKSPYPISVGFVNKEHEQRTSKAGTPAEGNHQMRHMSMK
jgi:hypothetical protein